MIAFLCECRESYRGITTCERVRHLLERGDGPFHGATAQTGHNIPLLFLITGTGWKRTYLAGRIAARRGASTLIHLGWACPAESPDDHSPTGAVVPVSTVWDGRAIGSDKAAQSGVITGARHDTGGKPVSRRFSLSSPSGIDVVTCPLDLTGHEGAGDFAQLNGIAHYDASAWGIAMASQEDKIPAGAWKYIRSHEAAENTREHRSPAIRIKSSKAWINAGLELLEEMGNWG